MNERAAGPPQLVRHARQADNVTCHIHLPDFNGFHLKGAEAACRRAHREALSNLIRQLDPKVWQPVRDAQAARRQAQELRAEADRVERDMHQVRAGLANVKADLNMPGQLKLSRERQLNQRMVELNGIHQGNVRDAVELERRADEHERQARGLCGQVAGRAVAVAQQSLQTQAERMLAEWAGGFPVFALLANEFAGPAGVDPLSGELWTILTAAPRGGQTHAPKRPRAENFELFDGGQDEYTPEDFDPTPRCPDCSTNLHWSVRRQAWVCVECDSFINTASPDGHYQAPAATKPTAPAEQPLFDPGLTKEQALQSFPYYAEWPPPGQPSLAPDTMAPGLPVEQQVGQLNGQQIDPYNVGAEAVAHAQRAMTGGVTAPAPRSANATEAPPTTRNDPTNGGWNTPTPASAVNNSPYTQADVDQVLRSLGDAKVDGPIIELGLNDFPM